MGKYYAIKANQMIASVEKGKDEDDAMLNFADNMDSDMNTYFYAEEVSRKDFNEFNQKGYIDDKSESFELRALVEDEVIHKDLQPEIVDKVLKKMKQDELFLQTLDRFVEDAINAVI